MCLLLYIFITFVDLVLDVKLINKSEYLDQSKGYSVREISLG